MTRAGFSLMEVVVVIAMAGVLAAVAAFSIPGLRSERNRTAADTLAVHLRHARVLALNRERTVRVAFSVSSNLYTVSIADTNAPGGFVAARDPVTQADWITRLSDNYPDTSITAADINGGTVLYFSRTNGIPCDASGQPLATTGTVAISGGRTVQIIPCTGLIRTP